MIIKFLSKNGYLTRFVGLVLLLVCGMTASIPSAGGVELSAAFGYGLQGATGGGAPYLKGSLSFGRRFVVDFNGGVIFAAPEIRFSNFSSTVPIKEKISDAESLGGSELYLVGMDVRVMMRKGSKRHNVYIGGGVDWLPQLATYYPGVKLSAGYQLSLLKKRSLVLRFGSEYYLYGVIPVNTFSLNSAIGYRF